MLNLTIKQILQLSKIKLAYIDDPIKSAVGHTLIFNPEYFSDSSVISALSSVNRANMNNFFIDSHADFPIREFIKSERLFNILNCILSNLYSDRSSKPELFESLFYPLSKVYFLGFEENHEWTAGWIKAHLSLDRHNTRLTGLFSAMKSINDYKPHIVHMIDAYDKIQSIPDATDFIAEPGKANPKEGAPYKTKHHHSIFSVKKNPLISDKEMANKVFGQKRPDGFDDPWREHNPSMSKRLK
jgi:hypothetical protein